MCAITIGIGYAMPVASIYSARKGAKYSALALSLIPSLILISQCVLAPEMFSISTLREFIILSLLLGVPLLLCLIGLVLTILNLRRK